MERSKGSSKRHIAASGKNNTAEKPREGSFLLILLGLALVIVAVIEIFNHKGLGGLFTFLKEHTYAFFANYLIVLAALSPALLFKRRAFYTLVASIVLLIGGAVNGFIILSRMTPFTTADVAVFTTGLEVLPNYLKPFQIVLLVVFVVLLLAGLILFFIKGPHSSAGWKRRLLTGAISVVCAVSCAIGGVSYGLDHAKLSQIFSNLAFAYEDYGFAYCFLNTWLNVGIHRPQDYSQQSIDGIKKNIEKDSALQTPKAEQKPNVVFVQLESFFDPKQIEGLELSEDALPNWHAMQKEFSHGFLTVPVVGAGTANTEFEVLSGMSTRFFGPGEYPYKTVMKDNCVESVAYDLKKLGYGTHAVHNHRGVFYGRNEVYKNMGFDSFTSLEYMSGTDTTPKNWAKDKMLTKEILLALDSSKQQDLVFTVSVQGHGKYPTTPVLEDPAITVEKVQNEDEHYAIEYYVNQIHEMDQFIRELTDALKKRDEKTVVVFYGDHLPSLGLGTQDVFSQDLYKTEYLMWDNFGMEYQKENLKAYQLSSEVLGRLGITEGVMNQYHQYCREEPGYLTDLRRLQYDVLYGRDYLYNGQNPYKPSKMRMGVADIEVTGFIKVEKSWYIEGNNFTSYCKATVNGKILETEFLNSHLLRVIGEPKVDSLDQIKISVVEKYNEVLSVTE